MRFYTQPHRFYCGIDLHARTMHLCILDADGAIVFDRNLASRPDAFLHQGKRIKDSLPYREFCLAYFDTLLSAANRRANNGPIFSTLPKHRSDIGMSLGDTALSPRPLQQEPDSSFSSDFHNLL